MPVIIAHCKCKSEFQDHKYGAGMRVQNTLKGLAGMRCTVCGNTVRYSVAKSEVKAAEVKKSDVKAPKTKSKLDRDEKSRETRRR